MATDKVDELSQIGDIQNNRSLPDIIFKEYLKGNVLLPQVVAGLGSYPLLHLLDREMTFSDFYKSLLSPDQLGTMGRIMHNVHAKAKNPVPYTYSLKSRTTLQHAGYVYDDDRLQELWGRLKDGVIQTTQQLFGWNESFSISNIELQKLDNFVNTPENIERVKAIRDVLAEVTQTFDDSHFKEVAAEYREAVSHHSFLNRQGRHAKDELERFQPEYDRARLLIPETVTDIIAQKRPINELDTKVISIVFRELYPSTDAQ